MTLKQVYIKDILAFLDNMVLGIDGLQGSETETMYIDNLADVLHVNKTTLDWVNPAKENKQAIAQGSKAKVLLVDDTIQSIEGKVLIRVKNPKLALAGIGNHFFVDKPKPGIHPTSIIHPEAKIGKDVTIGAYCVIGKATIGDYCVIDSNVRIYDSVVMGHHCEIKAGAVLGGAGFGYEKDANGNKFRFPQIGSLIMGDYVEVGANTCIDRGALSDTIIGDYTKIINLGVVTYDSV